MYKKVVFRGKISNKKKENLSFLKRISSFKKTPNTNTLGKGGRKRKYNIKRNSYGFDKTLIKSNLDLWSDDDNENE